MPEFMPEYHITFAEPYPRVMLMDRSTPLAAVIGSFPDWSKLDVPTDMDDHSVIRTRQIYPASAGAAGASFVTMRVDITVLRAHIVSWVEMKARQ